MTKLTLKTGTEQDFFQRGRLLAKIADQKGRLPDETIISFEDPANLIKLITTARLALFKSISAMPGSITEISERLHRDRSAVKRDLGELEKAGLISIEEKSLQGHGRMKEVRARASSFSLQAQVG